MAVTSEKEVEERLLEAGKKLLNPPPSVDELLSLLDRVETCLSRVEQSPSKSMQNAFAPCLKALVSSELFRHSNVDVNVAVASCISEITRITAPDAPYDDNQMKEVFQLIVSSFEGLSDNTSRSYSKRIAILETVAKVRSCVVMLDLECDALIIEMFQHFLQAIREYHPGNVIASMETIMTLVIEESEDIQQELLSPMLDCIRKDNKEVSPIAQTLVEKVLENTATKLKQVIMLALKSSNSSLGDYKNVIARICKETPNSIEDMDKDSNLAGSSSEQVNKEAPSQAVSAEEAPLVVNASKKSIRSNGVTEDGGDNVADDSKIPKSVVDVEAGDGSLAVARAVESELKEEEPAKDRAGEINPSQNETSTENLGLPSNNGEKQSDELPETQKKYPEGVSDSLQEDSVQPALQEGKKDNTHIEAVEGSSMNVDSSATGSLPDESHSEKGEGSKMDGAQQPKSSMNAVSEKVSEGASDSEVKSDDRLGKKSPAETSDQVEAPVAMEEDVIVADSEAPAVKQVEASSLSKEKSSRKKKEEKKQGQNKAIPQKGAKSSSAKLGDKVVVASPKSAAKSSKVEEKIEKTPMASSKRKRTPGKEKASDGKNDGEDLIGSKVKVWWPEDRKFYEGVIHSFDSAKKKHEVLYDDGDKELLNLEKERWELIQGDPESDEGHDTDASKKDSTERHQKKKAKTTPSREGKAVVSSERGTRTSGGKSTSSAAKSGQKSKDAGRNTDPKHKGGDSKAVSKVEINSSESEDEAPKLSAKTKKVEQSSSKSKSVTPKSVPKTKGKALKSGSKTNTSGAGKSKSGSASKAKDLEDSSEESQELPPKSQGSTKKKSPDSSKAEHTESKSGTKRRRGVRG